MTADLSKEHCKEHPNCVYRLEMLEAWKTMVESKLENFTKLLIANLAGIITLLGSVVIGLVVWIAQH